MCAMRVNDLIVKKPWLRVLPDGYMSGGVCTADSVPAMSVTPPLYGVVSQSDFLREYYPSGHRIHDPLFYPDIYREETVPVTDENGMETGRYTRRIYKEKVPRCSFAFQRVIGVKQIVHLCGNDIQFELLKDSPDAEETADFSALTDGWQLKNMECAFYEVARSSKITGDGAIVGYLDGGRFGWKHFSFLEGDVLYPHYGPTGELDVFARRFRDLDENGDVVTDWLEVFDDRKYYLFRRDAAGNSFVRRLFHLDGWKLVREKEHGFMFVPVAYRRNEEGGCWSFSQGSIEGYEVAFSQMVHNNQAYGFPILYFQGENTEIGHGMDGTIKTLTMGPDDKAGYLTAQSASEAFMTQLETLYKKIYEDSFTVIPPDVKSGDLPAAALKILYSPAYEKAMTDSHDYQMFLDSLVRIFCYGYGVEVGKSANFGSLPLKSWIKPYVHVSESTMVADLATAVQNGFASRQTASERISFYTSASEWDRIMRENKTTNDAVREPQSRETPL